MLVWAYRHVLDLLHPISTTEMSSPRAACIHMETSCHKVGVIPG